MTPSLRRAFVPTAVALGLAFLAASPALSAAGAAERKLPAKANYELAARFTPAKVGKMVFDTSVQPHWLETPNRFWYSYETNQGRRFMIVDVAARTRRPLFDNAAMAAQLTRIVLSPYDAQHLPIRTIKFVDKDAAIRFELEVPRDSDVRVGGKLVKAGDLEKKEEQTKDEKAAAAQDKDKEKKDQKADKDKKEEPKKTVSLFFRYELATGRLALLPDFQAPPKRPKWAALSPDEKTVVFARGHNLFMMDAASYALARKKADDKAVKEVQLTTDGEEHFSYARDLSDEDKTEYQKDEKDRPDYRVPAGYVIWSRDSGKIAGVREDERKVADLWVVNSLANPRPTLQAYRYAMPGEEAQPQPELFVLDLATKAKVKVRANAFKDQTLSIFTAPRRAVDREKDDVPPPQWLAPTSDKLYFGRQSRDLHRFDVCVADVATGDTKCLIEERLNTYVDVQPLRLVNGGREMLWWSERDGWGHYYLYDGEGRLKSQVTSGEFTCQNVESVDEKARVLYFEACGREPGEDPYFMHLYRVGLDGGTPALVTPGDATHTVEVDDGQRCVVDTFSRVDTAPKTVLRDLAGNLLLELETTDVSALLQAGYKFPEPFKVKADDGVTDLFGVLYKPFDFDETLRYPIIAYVYPGPQTESVTKSFSPRNGNVALAQLGFVVIEVGNRGGHPSRSKWYHNFGYGNLRDYGLADKKRAIEQLSILHPWIDIDRVGIYGHSGGGFMTAAALLVYPDFFKVGVSSSGNHENNVYNRWWSEKHHGVKEVADPEGNVKFEYTIDKNSDLAANLKGHLLLTTGDIDDNVHPANTLRLANALIRANKRFDFFVFPGQRHGYGDMNDYWFWIRADYFAKHLLDDWSQTVDLIEMQRETQHNGPKGAAR